MLVKSKWFQLAIAVTLGMVVMLLPRPEGTRFKVSGEKVQALVLVAAVWWKILGLV